MDQLIEIRSYVLKAGTAARFDRLMQQHCLPLLRAAGTEVVAARPSLHSSHAYVLIRAYHDLAQRNHSQDAFYGSAAWLQGPRDALMACIDNYTSVVIEADRSLIDSLKIQPTGDPRNAH